MPPPCRYALLLASAAERDTLPQAGGGGALLPLRHTVVADVDRLGGSDERGCLCLSLCLQERE